MESNTTVVFINMSGTIFESDADIFQRDANSLLGKLVLKRRRGQSEDKIILKFGRPVSSFEAILAYYQTGQLHIPNNVCPKAFEVELKFWKIDPSHLENCCLQKYLSFMSKLKLVDSYRNGIGNGELAEYSRRTSHWRSVRIRAWLILDNIETSMLSKVFLGVVMFFTLCSVFSLVLSTLPVFWRPLNYCQLKAYVQNNVEYGDEIYFLKFLENRSCVKVSQDDWYQYVDDLEYDFYNDDNNTDYLYIHRPTMIEKISNIRHFKLPEKSALHPAFYIIDYVVIGFFTIELVFRLATCPSFKTYFKDIFNLIEIFILAAAYAYIAIEENIQKYKLEPNNLEILQYFQMFRVFRILRVMKNVTAMRVLIHALRTAYMDVVVLLIYIFIGTLIYANLIYFVEDYKTFPSIPSAWWWSTITMTTVGYGDMIPHSPIGKIIGSFCALTGVFLIATIIPTFVNTFNSIYEYANLKHSPTVPKKNPKCGKIETNSGHGRQKESSVCPV